jgi:hypothetical protein
VLSCNWFESVAKDASANEYGNDKVDDSLGVPHVGVENVEILDRRLHSFFFFLLFLLCYTTVVVLCVCERELQKNHVHVVIKSGI